MASKGKRWIISKIANSASRKIESFDFELRNKVIKKLEFLQENPFENDIKKISGKKNIYRGRIGEYRYYFRTFPESKSIEILLFEHRSNIKKRIIQRLK